MPDYENLEGGLNALIDDSVERIRAHAERKAAMMERAAEALAREASAVQHLDATAKYAHECKHVLLQNLMRYTPPATYLGSEDPLPRIAQPSQEDAISRLANEINEVRHPFMKRIA